MSEQVINIRDRIEKMRTQMTGPKEAVARNEIGLDEKVENKNNQVMQKQNLPVERIDIKKADELSSIKEKLVKVEKQKKEDQVKEKISESQKFNKANFESSMSQSASASKTYKDYHNDNIFDENKKSIRLDEDQAFPQFNLNVSNPISWKLMLLIMLMQLLTNIMLVVVLYLK